MAKWLQAVLAEEGNGSLCEARTRREMQAIHMSIPATWDRTGNPYAARFYGWGLGWSIVDYRGRKACYHAGSSGTMLAIVPEEKLGLIVLANQEWSSLGGMLMYDIFDAYMADEEHAWDRTQWSFWKRSDPHPDRQRKNDLAKAKAKRKADIANTIERTSLVGSYSCPLYGDLVIRVDGDQLTLQFGVNDRAIATHWQQDTYYVRRPVSDDASVDWLVTFHASNDSSSPYLTIKRLGWDEPLPRFVREKD